MHLKSILSILLLLISFWSFGQRNVIVNNDINYHFATHHISPNGYLPTFQFKASPDTDGIPTNLMTFEYEMQTGAEFCWYPGLGDYQFRYLETQKGTSNPLLDVHVIAYNKGTNQVNACFFSANGGYPDDHNFGAYRSVYDVTQKNPNEWAYTDWILDLNEWGTTVRSIWRYKHGDNINDPLELGSLTNGTTFHANSNNPAPSGADSDLGYTSTTGNSSPDIFYSFTLSGNKAVTINPIQLGGGRARLYRDDGTFISGYSGFITATLEAGTYIFMVEGATTVTGALNVSVTIEDPKPNGGSISQILPDSLCQGVEFPEVPNRLEASIGTAYSVGFNENPTYSWERKVGGLDFVLIQGATSSSLPRISGEEMDDQDVSFRRKADFGGGIEAYSNTITFHFQSSSITAGDISYFQTDKYTREGYEAREMSLQNAVNNQVAASAEPAPLRYRWIYKGNTSSTWDTIINGQNYADQSSLTTEELGALYEDTDIRRIAINGCNKKAESNTILVRAVKADGTISGKVTAPPAGAGTGIEDVLVCATPKDALWGVETECTLTNATGDYTIDSLYFGLTEIEYELSATLLDHDIRIREDLNNPNPNDSTYLINLSQSNKTHGAKNFVDLTVYTLKGNVNQSFSGKKYGKMGVTMTLTDAQGIPKSDPVLTDENGNYEFIIPNPGRYIVKPSFTGTNSMEDQMAHEFIPAMLDTIILDNIDSVEFVDNANTRISGSILAGCDQYLGRLDIRIEDLEKDSGAVMSFSEDIRTDASGEFSLIIPAREYKIQILQATLTDVPNKFSADDIKSQFAKLPSYHLDLNFDDGAIHERYKAPPVVEFEGIPNSLSCDDIPIIAQFERYPDFKVKVWEGPASNSCPLDTGYISVNIGGTGYPNPFPISQGYAQGFELQGGKPNIVAPYTHTLSVTAHSFDTDNTDIKVQEFIVTGENPKGQTFVTTSPQVPLYILHDPPTDGGYSFLEKDNTRSVGLKTFAKRSDQVGAWGEIKLGVSGEVAFGVAVESGYNLAFWGTLDGDISGTTTTTTSSETVFGINTNERYETSNTINGEAGDIFISGAINYSYSKTDKIEYDSMGCEVILSESATFNPDSISTIFSYTTTGVENQIAILQDLKNIDQALPNPTHPPLFYDSQISSWQQMLELNRKNKEETIAKGGGQNISINGGVTQSYSKTITTDTIASFETLIEMDQEIGIGAGFEIAGSGLQGRAYFRMRQEFTPKDNPATDSIETNSITTGYVLSDGEDNDRFSIDIYEDQQYGTPLFDLKSSTTSCPYELWDANNPGERTNEFTISPKAGFPTQATNVNPNIGQEFRLIIKNNSLENNTNFIVYQDAVFNSFGALILIQGQSGQVTLLDIGPGEEAEVSITVRQDPAIKVSNHQVRIRVEPECSFNGNFNPDRDYSQTIDFNVTFQSDCSNIEMVEPQPGRIVNLADNGTLPISMRNYDKSKMSRVFLEYRPTGAASSKWVRSTSFDFEPIALSDLPSGDTKNWQLTDIPDDGAYDIRLTTICDGGTTNGSAIVPIIIDRQKPVVFGIPSPIDDIYDQSDNDEISVSYNEPICNNGITQATATIVDLVSGDEISGIVSCNGNTIKIVESGTSLNNRPPSAYRVILSGVTDLNGNTADTYRWVFLVGGYTPEELGCIDNLEIVNNNENQDAINVSTYRALSIVSNGQIPNFGTTSYMAETEVTLDGGFEVLAGGEFIADIATCEE